MPAHKAKKKSSAVPVQESMPGEIVQPEEQQDVPVQSLEVGDNSEETTPTEAIEPETNVQMATANEPAPEDLDFPTHLENTSTPMPAERDKDTLQQAPVSYEVRKFDGIDPKDHGIEEDDLIYAPPMQDENLPDLHNLIDALEGGNGDLDGQMEPPSLFTRPEHEPQYKKISALKVEMEEAEVGPYLEEFEDGVRDDVLMIGSIALEEIQDEEHRLRDEHIQYEEQEMKKARERQEEVMRREELAKKRTAVELKEARKELQRRQALLLQKERIMMDRMHKAFRRAENQLISRLESRKGEVKTMFGDLTLLEGNYGGSKGRRWKVDWDKTPQPVQIKLKTLRGVKDKLPGGRYVLMVSLYNRLGGHVMRWSNLRGQLWGGTTLPVAHEGNFYNTEMKMDQSVFTVLPSKPGIRPGMVLIFELFLLRGEVLSNDRVVAWGCFPITDSKFDVVEGKYKCPMLRGELDPKLDKHEKMEELMSSDMDHWLCNAYFEIVCLPRYLAGQKEYEVELQFSSGLLSYPDRVETGGEEYKDGEAPVPGSMVDVNSVDSSKAAIESDRSLQLDSLARSQSNLGSTSGDNDSIKKLPVDVTEEEETKMRASSRPDSRTSLRQRRPMSTIGSRFVHRNKGVKLEGESDESDYDEKDLYLVKDEDGFKPVKGHPGIYYKRYLNNPVDEYHKKLYTLFPKTTLLNNRQLKRKRMTYLQKLEEHSFSVKDPITDKGHLAEEGNEKMNYVRRQLLAEIGLSEWRSREFWGMIFFFILVFFARLFLHYVGQWLFLNGRRIPINKFEFLPYTVMLNYQPSLLDVMEEAVVVILGPLSNIIAFAFFVFVSWVLQRLVGQCPDIASKFILVFGIMSFLDPFLIIGVDCALQRWQDLGGDDPIGDFAKLYWHFNRAQGSGLAGIFITIFLYMFVCFLSGSILYMYFLRLHNNGRMLDIYWRLRGTEDMFFIPYDLEMSNQELSFILKHSEQWRGEEGERRKTAVYDYIWEEENDEDEQKPGEEEVKIEEDGEKEVTTHISVHTLHLDGLRELYRQFLRLPDGAIIEVFGDMNMAGVGKDISTALKAQSKDLESGTSSAGSIAKPNTPGGSSGGGLDLGVNGELAGSSSV